jgi:hypothetical protein
MLSRVSFFVVRVTLVPVSYLSAPSEKFIRIELFILKNMGTTIIDFRVCPPLVKCKNLMFSGFIDAPMYGFSSTGVTIYCYFGLKLNDNTCCEVICKRRYNDNDIMTTNKLPCMYFFLITVIFPIQDQYKYYLIKNACTFFLFSFFLLPFKHKKKWVIKLTFCMKLKSKYINYNIRFLKLLLYDLK